MDYKPLDDRDHTYITFTHVSLRIWFMVATERNLVEWNHIGGQ